MYNNFDVQTLKLIDLKKKVSSEALSPRIKIEMAPLVISQLSK